MEKASLFASAVMGGFEGAHFTFWDGRAVDCIAGSNHDRHCAIDYGLLQDLGIQTVRDSFRWPLIETRPGQYDWSSIEPMLEAAAAKGVQVIWDLCHFGIPAHIDVAAADFANRFADYAFAAAQILARIDPRPPWWCPVNEISYWSYAAGAAAYMVPVMPGQADTLKRQFVKAYLAAQHVLVQADPRARFVAVDPLICISDENGVLCEERKYGFEAWDMLTGSICAELGGSLSAIDVIGVNYYSDNQWRRENGARVGMGQRGYRPLRLLLADTWERYRKPIILSETGAEHPNGPNWMAYVMNEIRHARDAGVQIEGLCLYPVADYPGWTDDRHCPCGLIELDEVFEERRSFDPMLASLKLAQAQFENAD